MTFTSNDPTQPKTSAQLRAEADSLDKQALADLTNLKTQAVTDLTPLVTSVKTDATGVKTSAVTLVKDTYHTLRTEVWKVLGLGGMVLGTTGNTAAGVSPGVLIGSSAAVIVAHALADLKKL
jgi:hypothetical protein